MKQKTSKIWMFLAVVALLAVILPVVAMAEESQPVKVERQLFAASPNLNILDRYVDTDALKAYIVKEIANCPKEIDVSSFRIPADDKTVNAVTQFYHFFYNYIPEMFNLEQTWYYTDNGILTRIVMEYVDFADTASEYASCMKKFKAAADAMLFGIKDNGYLSDVEKALLLHDRLAAWTEYDYANFLAGTSPGTVYSAYGVFVNQVAVCQGYALAYMYLLDQVGIENDYCSSELLDHAWNIVYINGKPYHVDVTWDDPVWDMTGQVKHTNFLRSTAGFKETGHIKNGIVDYDQRPSSTTYDNYAWQNSSAEFQLLNDRIYYIDNVDNALKIWSGSSGTSIYTISGKWKSDNGGNWTENYARLDNNGKNLLYSLPDGIYTFDLSNYTSGVHFRPDLNVGTNFSVFGFKYEKGCLYYDLSNHPVYKSGEHPSYFGKKTGDIHLPQADFLTSYSATTSQILYVQLWDDIGVSGYYFGTNSDYRENKYYDATNGNVELTVSTAGTHYIRLVDKNKNLSDNYNFTYCKITLNANGGTVKPAYVIAMKGVEFTFPTATLNGKNCIGWSTNAKATSGVKKLTPTANATYYAVYQYAGLQITKQPVSVKVLANKTATVSLTATGDGLTYKWYYKNKGDSKFTYTGTFKGNTYSVTMDATRNGRQVYCIVEDKLGRTVQTNIVTLSMATKPTITKAPASVKAANGKTASVSVTASGEGLKYTWYVLNPGASSYVKSSITKSTYSFTMASDKSGRKVYCVITDKYGQTVKTSAVTMSMAAKPKITKQPSSVVKVLNGKTASVSVTASGDGLKYTWYVLNPGASSYVKSSVTKSTYSFTMASDKSGRKVYCVVTDKYGQTVKSSVATMSKPAVPKITKQPVSVNVKSGATAKVTFTASGEGLTYKWYYKDKGQSAFKLTTTFTGNTYSTQMTSARSGRQLYCVVTDKYGQKVQTKTVTIALPTVLKITKQPVSVKVINGATAKVTLTAAGDGLTYKWYYKDKGQSKFSLTTSFKTNSYSVQMNSTRSGRQLYCVVTDKYGKTVKTNTVTISMIAAPKITKQPVSVTAANGATAKVTFTASGEGLTYKWYYKDKGQSKFSLTTSFKTNTYSVEMTSARSGRQLYCVVTDKYGQKVQTKTVTISLKQGAKITGQPVSVKANIGSKATVKVTATGDGLTYKWYYAEKGSSTFKLTTSFTGNTYSVEMSNARNGRRVYCVVTDKYGKSVKSNVATLTAIQPVKASVYVETEWKDGRQYGYVELYDAKGGTGSYLYAFEVYVDIYADDPALTYDLSSREYCYFSSGSGVEDVVVVACVADNMGNVMAYLVDMSGNVLNSEYFPADK